MDAPPSPREARQVEQKTWPDLELRDRHDVIEEDLDVAEVRARVAPGERHADLGHHERLQLADHVDAIPGPPAREGALREGDRLGEPARERLARVPPPLDAPEVRVIRAVEADEKGARLEGIVEPLVRSAGREVLVRRVRHEHVGLQPDQARPLRAEGTDAVDRPQRLAVREHRRQHVACDLEEVAEERQPRRPWSARSSGDARSPGVRFVAGAHGRPPFVMRSSGYGVSAWGRYAPGSREGSVM